MAQDMIVWVNSPGYLRGIGLLTQAAAADAIGVVDLGGTSPKQWGCLNYNLLQLQEFYPKNTGLGFRVSIKYFNALIALPAFPQHLNFFFCCNRHSGCI